MSDREGDRLPDRERERGQMTERERGPDTVPDRERERDQKRLERVLAPLPQPPVPAVAFLDGLDLATVPVHLKKESSASHCGTEWLAVWNPAVKQSIADMICCIRCCTNCTVVCCVRFSKDGRFFATGCNRTAQVYDSRTGVEVCSLIGPSVPKGGDLYIRSVCLSLDGALLATGAEDTQIWDLANKRIIAVLSRHQQEIYALDFSVDGRFIVSGSGDKAVRIWDMRGVSPAAPAPQRALAAGWLDSLLRLWDVRTGALVRRLRGHGDSVYSVAFVPETLTAPRCVGLVSGGLDRTGRKKSAPALQGWKEGPLSAGVLKGWKEENDEEGKCTVTFTGDKDYVLSVAVSQSHDGEWVVSGFAACSSGTPRQGSSSACSRGTKTQSSPLTSPAGNVLATGSGDWHARIWSYDVARLSVPGCCALDCLLPAVLDIGDVHPEYTRKED
ncbi:chromatin associated protein [Mycena belliarum]|uniref:Chromatin associated protein n=1 Tax=Mycena belliarum TaxID=1033014 RepID=A0AAD6UI30_9AGAR|nr:chromatin associated protein [Mycena belliae]